jgi:hypothetical protein
MASEVSAPMLVVSGIWADGYFWISAAALFMGLAAGQSVRALSSLRDGGRSAGRLRSRRSSRAIAFLSLGILGAAGFLVLADRQAALRDGGLLVLVIWASFVCLLAFLAGLRWLAAGLPLGLLCIAILMLFRLGLRGWTAMEAGSSAGFKIATFLPYELGPVSSRGHLELFGQDSVPVDRELSLGSDRIALSVESLAFSGPLGLVAKLAATRGSSSIPPAGRFFRVVGIAAPGGISQSFSPPPYSRFLDALLPLPQELAREPGGSPAEHRALFGLARRSRQTGSASSLVALDPISFNLSQEGLPSPNGR